MLGEYTLKNGRRFRVEDTGEPFDKEVRTGGYEVEAYNEAYDTWVGNGNYENMEQVERFILMAEGFAPFAESETLKKKKNKRRWNPRYQKEVQAHIED